MPLKALLLIAHLLLGLGAALAIAALDACGAGRRIPRERIARWWHGDLLRILRVHVHARGAPLRAPRLTVANHVSWLDVPVLGSIEETRFVSRHDVQQWPVAGQLADACGTFYIVRGKGGAGRVAQRLAPHLAQGGSVVLFPEGTTTDGSAVLPFHARLFEAPLAAGVAVQPVALRYSRGGDGTALAPFVGETTLLRHVLRVLASRELHVEVSYGSALVADAQTRRDGLAAQAQRWVARVVARGPFEPAGAPRRRSGQVAQMTAR
ncbi:MAG TPA: lysophospholipid acyltransferase family protein [Solimonas sp.]|nr:lysophospholipid acyltransferase family protein [Solimonas sp.]